MCDFSDFKFLDFPEKNEKPQVAEEILCPL